MDKGNCPERAGRQTLLLRATVWLLLVAAIMLYNGVVNGSWWMSDVVAAAALLALVCAIPLQPDDLAGAAMRYYSDCQKIGNESTGTGERLH